MWRVLVSSILLTGCGEVSDKPVDAPRSIDTPVAIDSAIDAVQLGPFGAAAPVVGITAVTTAETDVSLTNDELEIYFATDRPGTGGGRDIWWAKRATVSDAWGSMVELAVVNSITSDVSPQVSRDGLTLWFGSDRVGGQGTLDIYVSVRASRAAPWGAPIPVIELSSVSADRPGLTTGNALRMAMYSDRSGAAAMTDVYETTRPSLGAAWTTPIAHPMLNTLQLEANPCLSYDGLTVIFTSGRAGSQGHDLYIATRSSVTEQFGAPAPVAELNTVENEGDPWISEDLRRIYFSRTVGGVDLDLVVAAR